MADFAKTLTPRPYHLAGTRNLVEMANSLSDLAAKVLPTLDVDQRTRFREEVGKYDSFEQCPVWLQDMILDALMTPIVTEEIEEYEESEAGKDLDGDNETGEG